MFKEVMNDLWLARISSLLNEVGVYDSKQPFYDKVKNKTKNTTLSK